MHSPVPHSRPTRQHDLLQNTLAPTLGAFAAYPRLKPIYLIRCTCSPSGPLLPYQKPMPRLPLASEHLQQPRIRTGDPHPYPPCLPGSGLYFGPRARIGRVALQPMEPTKVCRPRPISHLTVSEDYVHCLRTAQAYVVVILSPHPFTARSIYP